MTEDIKAKIGKTDSMKGKGATKFNKRTYALLNIKPPDISDAPLIVSGRQTQLADIPATVYDMLNLKQPKKSGMSVFSKDFPDDREIHVFSSKADYKTGFDHFSHTSRKKWKVYPKVLFNQKSKKVTASGGAAKK